MADDGDTTAESGSGSAPGAAAEMLAGAVTGAAAEAGVTPERAGDEERYLRGGTLFAVLAEARLELRMPPDIGDAALRTPDTTPGQRGAGWVTFQPRSAEQHVADRARAWFVTAFRYAGGRGT